MPPLKSPLAPLSDAFGMRAGQVAPFAQGPYASVDQFQPNLEPFS